MNYNGAKTLNGIKAVLECRFNKVTREREFYLAGERIGRMVTYGKRNMMHPSRSVVRPTVFASRIHLNGLRIEEEAQSATALKNKVAKAIYDWMKLQAEEKVEPSADEDKATVPKM